MTITNKSIRGTICLTCEGNGFIECWDCDGLGEYDCDCDWENGEECRACKNRFEHSEDGIVYNIPVCDTCQGEGTIVCPDCEGDV